MDDDHGNNQNPRVKQQQKGRNRLPRHASFAPSSTSLAVLPNCNFQPAVDLRLPERVRVLVVPARRSTLFSRPRHGFLVAGRRE